VNWANEVGGVEYARAEADAYARSASDALSEVPQGPATEALHAAIAYATQRTR